MAAQQPGGAPAPKKKSAFGSFMSKVDKVGKDLGKEIDKAAVEINRTVDKNYSSALLDLFKDGNVIQLVAKSSGHTLQIVVSPTGELIIDAAGPLDPSAFNTLWTVKAEGNNQIQLYNHNNFIVIIDGVTRVVFVPQGAAPGPETKFQLSQTGQFVYLESLTEKGQLMAFVSTGAIKPGCKVKENDAQFGVKLVSTAYPVMK